MKNTLFITIALAVAAFILFSFMKNDREKIDKENAQIIKLAEINGDVKTMKAAYDLGYVDQNAYLRTIRNSAANR